FALRLDSGGYDVGLIPPGDGHLPRSWVEAVQLASDTDLGIVQLDSGIMVTTQVVDAAGQPSTGSKISLYAIAPKNVGPDACAATDPSCVSPARLSAEGPPGPGGVIRLLLPASH